MVFMRFAKTSQKRSSGLYHAVVLPLPQVFQSPAPPRNPDFETSSVATMADLPPLEYTPLSARQIRILAPASTEPVGLSWVLKTIDIDDPHLFTALSYAWACHTHPDAFPISCNGRQLYVHQNLFTALPFIARRYTNTGASATPYWIDAVCYESSR